MPGRLVRSVCTLATLAGTVAVGPPASPAPDHAVAAVPAPSPTGSPTPSAAPAPARPGGARAPAGRARASGPPAPGEPRADAAPAVVPGTVDARTPVSQLLFRLRELRQRSADAARGLATADQALRAQRGRTRDLDRHLARVRAALARARVDAGRLARQQYQGLDPAGASGYLRLLLARDPQAMLDQRHLLDRAAAAQAATLARLSTAERTARDLSRQAGSALARSRALAAEQRRRRDALTDAIGETDALLASLTPAQLGALRALERGRPSPPAAPAAPPSGRRPTPRAASGKTAKDAVRRGPRPAAAASASPPNAPASPPARGPRQPGRG